MREVSSSQTIFLWANALLAACLIMPNTIFNVSIGIWAISCLAVLIQHRSFSLQSLRQNKVALAFLALFGAVAFGVSYSADKAAGLFMLERILLFVAAPFLLLAINAFENKIKVIRYSEIGFLLGTSVALMYCYAVSFSNIIPLTGMPSWLESPAFHAPRFEWYFTYQVFASAAGLHAVYFSAYLTIGFFIILQERKRNSIRWIKWLLSILAFFFALGVILLKSANVSFSFLLLGIIYLVINPEALKRKKLLWSSLLGLASAAAIVILLLKAEIRLTWTVAFIVVSTALLLGLLVPRILRLLSKRSPLPNSTIFIGLVMFIMAATILLPQIKDFGQLAKENPSNVAARYWNWRSATDLILEQPIFGLGTGEASTALLQKYEEYGFKAGVKYEFNEHSQYLRYWLDGGLLCLFVFFWLLYEMFNQATERRYFPMLALLVVLIFFCITESALVRRSFISLAAFFGVLYSYATVGFGQLKNRVKP